MKTSYLNLLKLAYSLANDLDYIELAKDYLGTAIRDNSKEELIEIGKKIEKGEWE